MPKDFDIFGNTARLARPFAHSLSQNMTVGDRGWPRSARIARSSTAMRAAVVDGSSARRVIAWTQFGGPIDLAPIWMRGDKSEETIKAGHGREGGRGLFHGESTDGGEDAGISALLIVEQVAYRHL